MTLGDLHLGSRLLYRSKKDWRTAVVSRIAEDGITISVASPTGYNYRVKRPTDDRLEFHGAMPLLVSDFGDLWQENFSSYDKRW
ncbi:hypothetical protein [Leptolyngbya sp. 7M]|uniref:hypothetical protein n=1 Tax=Leptolyngbya sp. 7M TaxID=2812896 RepID=UPI001B8B6F83|nr:hypothetical protein [Leptolyngbya sp. 7M]QYO66166.1 hypothetical protein JVX88_05025 [Leptolyngbya sp. 7M]